MSHLTVITYILDPTRPIEALADIPREVIDDGPTI